MIYESYLGGFDWNAFSNIIGSVGQAGSSIYNSYTQLEAARRTTADVTRQKQIDLQIAELQTQAIQLMAEKGATAQSSTMKNLMPLAVVGGAGLLTILAMQ